MTSTPGSRIGCRAAATWHLELACGHREQRAGRRRVVDGLVEHAFPPPYARCHACPLTVGGYGPRVRVLLATLRWGRRALVRLRFSPRRIGPRLTGAEVLTQARSLQDEGHADQDAQ